MDSVEDCSSLKAKIKELENTIKTQSKIIAEYKSKEQSISSAIIASMEHANQLEASRKKLYSLDIQRSRLLYLRMEQIINELIKRYPEVNKDGKLKTMSQNFKDMVYDGLEVGENSALLENRKQPVDDPIKKLLHNIINCFDDKKSEEQKSTKVEDFPRVANVATVPSNSGFDFNEALNPTMGLDEIMKAFNIKADKKSKN